MPKPRKPSPLLTILAALILWVGPLALAPARAQAPEWVEPRALNIVDLAGQVPDDILRGAFISSNGAAGVSEFVSSEIDGEVLRITARVYARRMWNGATGHWSTKIPLLGQRPTFDHMGSSAPESWVVLYENGRRLDPTMAWIEYIDPALAQPLRGAWEPWRRYREVMISGGPLRVDQDGVYLPANYGGELGFAGDHPDLTAVYTVRLAARPSVTYLTTQASEFQSYVGPGDVGLLASLMSQLQANYADRHGRIPLAIPAGADYVLLHYPMIPFYVYDSDNLQRPSTGSVRLAPADFGMLSADLVHGGAFPLNATWQDAGQVKWRAEDPTQPDPAASQRFLTRLPPAVYVSPPEYVVPAGVLYNECFRSGGCPGALLESIYNARMTLRITYLRVDAAGAGSTRIPLRMTDDSWEPRVTAPAGAIGLLQGGFSLFLPFTIRPSDPTIWREVPLGVFDGATGRMVDYMP